MKVAVLLLSLLLPTLILAADKLDGKDLHQANSEVRQDKDSPQDTPTTSGYSNSVTDVTAPYRVPGGK